MWACVCTREHISDGEPGRAQKHEFGEGVGPWPQEDAAKEVRVTQPKAVWSLPFVDPRCWMVPCWVLQREQHWETHWARIVTVGISGGRSLRGRAPDARHFPSTRWYPVPGATRTTLGFGICPSLEWPSVAPCQTLTSRFALLFYCLIIAEPPLLSQVADVIAAFMDTLEPTPRGRDTAADVPQHVKQQFEAMEASGDTHAGCSHGHTGHDHGHSHNNGRSVDPRVPI